MEEIPEAIVDAEFPIGTKTLEMKVDQNVLTEAFLKEVDKDNQRSLSFALSKLVISWNNSDSEPALEYFMTLPLTVLNRLFDVVTGVLTPKKTTSETSEDTTSAAAASV